MISWTPTTVMAGGPDFTLIVNGTGFVTASPPLVVGSVVQWNGSNLPTQWRGYTQLSASVSASLIATPGAATIRIVNPAGAVSATGTITITEPPLSISSLAPASVSAGGPAFTVIVNGNGFLSGATVQWNGSALTTSFVSATQLTASVPASLIAAPGNLSVKVINPGGVASTPVVFTINPVNPIILSFSPASADMGGPDFNLTINGSGFLSAAAVWWDLLPLTTNFISATRLTASVPARLIAAPGSASVKVVNPGGATSSVMTFSITASARPAISSLSPASATAGGAAFTLSINGTGFVFGAAAQWNGSPLTTTFVSATELRASVPANLIAVPGSASVTVMNSGGVISSTKEFLIGPAGPAEVSIADGGIVNAASSQPLVAPGSLVSIYGTNLAKETGNATETPLPLTLNGSAVLINGNAVPLLFVSPTQINAQVPFEATLGRATVVVKANGHTSAPAAVEVRATAPGILTIPPGNHALAQNAGDWSLNSAQNPARPEDCVIVYLTGQGLVDKPMATGAAAPTNPLLTPLASVQVKIGGQPARVLFAGLTPGLVGLLQINAIVPSLATGEQALEVSIGDVAANATLISVRGN
jgi:uncharacterized protein (TIGR03437 family)